MPDASLSHRRQERVPVKVTVRISTIDPETDVTTGKPYFRTSEETCANVSRGGTFVESSELIAAGRRLLLEIDIPGGPSIQTLGRVAWTRTVLEPSPTEDGITSSGFGIEFMGGSPDHLSKLQEFVERNERLSQPSPKNTGWKTPGTARHNGA